MYSTNILFYTFNIKSAYNHNVFKKNTQTIITIYLYYSNKIGLNIPVYTYIDFIRYIIIKDIIGTLTEL